ncbi:MAG TPA: TonB-dependent receptor plug domain-containing protein, partial [Negativicutes bacterium]
MNKKMRRLFYSFALAGVSFVWISGIAQAEEIIDQAQTGNAQTTAANSQTTNVSVTEVEVKANKEQLASEGSAAAGYKVDTAKTTGPWGNMKQQDIPYSINVMSAELIENLQASSVDTLYKINPVIQPWTVSTRGAGGNANMLLRGFSAANSSARAEDGIHGQLMTVSLEDKERVEVLTGLSGFLYGPSNVGGMINYVNKRPTFTPLTNITVGNYGGSEYYAHADLGGPLGKDGKFAYRLNLLSQDGDTAVDNQSINRKLFSGALDWHISDNAVLQFNAAHEDSTIKGTDAAWSFATNADGSAKAFHNVVPDSAKNWGQPFAISKMVTDKWGMGLHWKLNDVFTLRSAFRYADDDQRPGSYVNNTVSNNGGSYSQTINYSPEYDYISKGGYALLDGVFKTGSVNHKVTFGYFGDRLDKQQLLGVSSTLRTLNNLDFLNPTYISQPSFNITSSGRTATVSTSRSQNIVFGDDIKFDERWSALLGVN